MNNSNTSLERILLQKTYAAYYSKDYAYTKEHFQELREPYITVKDLQKIDKRLTYRKINDWDSKGLVSGSRSNKESGWRKFSVADVVKLLLTLELRDLGFPTTAISGLLAAITRTALTLHEKPEITDKGDTGRFLQFEHAVFSCFGGGKMVLVMLASGEVYLLEENDAISGILADTVKTPTLLLPFHACVEKIRSAWTPAAEKKPSSADGPGDLTEQEKRIIDFIRKREYEEISIRWSDKEEVLIAAKPRSRP